MSQHPIANPSARIAVVDNDRATLAILTDILRSGGFEVLPFDTGEAALEALRREPADLVVIDLLLPRMSGIDLARELRRLPWAESAPVLAITALRWNAEQAVAIQDAMAPARLVRKPVTGRDLLAIVQEMLGRTTPDTAAA